MTFEELKQQHEDNLDYLIECLEENPMDIEAYHYYNTRSNEINHTFCADMLGELG